MKKILASIALFVAVCGFALFFPGCTLTGEEKAATVNAGTNNAVCKVTNVIRCKRSK